ncbi:MAG TPA: hypothetical protein VNX86_13935 [Rhizomicrobium sp.]|jgi:hypothetical protein|nr:hypothetical protein [Rhizomicrobium sp.]
MKLTFLPTMTDLREMLGDKLYVEFVWMWREQEQAVRTQERRAKWCEQLPVRNAEEWPQPLFQRIESPEPVRIPEAKPAQVALLRRGVQRLLEQKAVNAPDWMNSVGRSDQDDEPALPPARVVNGYHAAAE